jgi:transcriptional regulator with XRE-family HTH domain
MREVVEDACRRAGGVLQLADMLGLSDQRVVEGWLDGTREPQSRFRSTILTVAGHPLDWRDLPRDEVAKRLGVHPKTVAAWQRGERDMPQRYRRTLRDHQPGDAVRTWRRHAGLSASELAERVGVHTDTLLSWERTERVPEPFSHHLLYQVCGEEALWWWPLSEVHRARRRRGCDRAEIAKVLGVSHNTLRLLENGTQPLTRTQREKLERFAPSRLGLR